MGAFVGGAGFGLLGVVSEDRAELWLYHDEQETKATAYMTKEGWIPKYSGDVTPLPDNEITEAFLDAFAGKNIQLRNTMAQSMQTNPHLAAACVSFFVGRRVRDELSRFVRKDYNTDLSPLIDVREAKTEDKLIKCAQALGASSSVLDIALYDIEKGHKYAIDVAFVDYLVRRLDVKPARYNPLWAELAYSAFLPLLCLFTACSRHSCVFSMPTWVYLPASKEVKWGRLYCFNVAPSALVKGAKGTLAAVVVWEDDFEEKQAVTQEFIRVASNVFPRFFFPPAAKVERGVAVHLPPVAIALVHNDKADPMQQLANAWKDILLRARGGLYLVK